MKENLFKKYDEQTRNEIGEYKKERIFYTLDEAKEILEQLSFKYNGKTYVGLSHKMVDEALKIKNIKEKDIER